MSPISHAPSPSAEAPYGLAWINDFGWAPRFTVDPSLEALAQIARRHLPLVLSPDSECTMTISFLAEGALNKVYKVDCALGQYVLRVALPLGAPDKVESEVATTSFLREHTTLPLPRVLAYDPNNLNDLCFPWILMEYVPSVPLTEKRWAAMSWEKKEDMVRLLAQVHARLYEMPFEAIGSLRLSPFPSADRDRVGVSTDLKKVGGTGTADPSELHSHWHSHAYDLGPVQSMDFLRASASVPRGPFRTSKEWIEARLVDGCERLERQIQESNEEDVVAQAKAMLSLAKRLLPLVPPTFPESHDVDVGERMILFLHDIHCGNVLVDDAGTLLAVIDFELVSTAPLWQACQVPKLFIPDIVRRNPPTKDMYPVHEDSPPEELEDGTNDKYWTHLVDYEQGLLRTFFLEEMEKLQPEWTKWHEQGRTRREFLVLVESVSAGETTDEYEIKWLDAFERGESTEGIMLEDNDDWRYEGSWDGGDEDELDELGDEEEEEEEKGSAWA